MTNHHQSHTSSAPSSHEDSFNTSEAILRLLVGLALEGVDALDERLREWEQEASHSPSQTMSAPPTDYDRLRHALIGMVFAGRQRAEDDLMTWLRTPERITKRMIDAADKLSSNPFLRPFVKPIRDQGEEISARMQNEFERWVRIGRAEEQGSRSTARIAAAEITDEVLTYLSNNPKVRDLIQQQSVGLAEEVVDSVRDVSASADAMVEGIVRRALRRKPIARVNAPNEGLPDEH